MGLSESSGSPMGLSTSQSPAGKPDALSHQSDHGSRFRDNNDMVLLGPSLFAIYALEGLEVIGEEQDILKDIWKRAENGEKEEAVAKVAKELQKMLA